MSDNKAFRDYATRVSFNMTLSRNQIFTLRVVMMDIEMQNATFDDRTRATYNMRKGQMEENLPDRYVCGIRALLAMGLVENDPRWAADEKQCDEAKARGERAIKKYWGPSCQITEAGEHIVALLRIAGLIAPAAVNQNRKGRRKAS
jgi:hypothetical protein